jgi:hypothetical protein
MEQFVADVLPFKIRIIFEELSTRQYNVEEPQTVAEHVHNGLKLAPLTVTVPPEYNVGGVKGLMFDKDGGFSTVNAKVPETVLKIDIVIKFGLLHVTLMEQNPIDTEGLIVVVIMDSDTTLHIAVGRLQTIAVQFCDSETKLAPNKLMVAPE